MFRLSAHFIKSILIATLLLTAITACNRAPGKIERPVIVLCTWAGYAPFYLARETGIFKKYGLAPRLLTIEDESQYPTALISGKVDFIANSLDREVLHFAERTPSTIILALDKSHGADMLISDNSIHSIAELRNKKIGVDFSTTAYFFLLYLFEQHQLSEQDMQLLNMSTGDAAAAFATERLDAVMTWQPWASVALKRANSRVLTDSADHPTIIVDVLIERNDYLQEHPDVGTRLASAWFEAIDYIRAFPNESYTIMAPYYNVSPAAMKRMLSGLNLLGLHENKQLFSKNNPDGIYSLADRAVKFWVKNNRLAECISVEALFSTNIVSAAAHQTIP